ncbi:anaerobic sulfatase maturase [Polycladidibacter hongkongensis]|uniref:anaerobic sulfatase maturase n=1 Tax=Polycladidibacter hongkongensis TaxID=1647556 RepID=UPI0009E87FA0|nr:anaerobic sulfatase maturase [Pseudovibrio hongkongensis]
MQNQPYTLMAKPAGPLCNLDCKYCYYLEKEQLFPSRSPMHMSELVLERYIKDYIKQQYSLGLRQIGFNWQGGEPTISGIAFYKRAVELQQKHCPKGAKITNAFQTNGILIEENWARFFKEHDFLVGLSIDGPKELHDANRPDKAGRPTFDKVMRAAQILQEHGVATNALVTVNRANAKKPLQVYRFLKASGFRFLQFIPIVERTLDGSSLASAPQLDEDGIAPFVTDWSVLPRDYGQFLKAVFDEWLASDVGKISVQLFDVQLEQTLGLPAGLCWFAPTCGNALALEHNGDLYACDHYVYPQYKLGNICETPMGDLVSSESQLAFGQDKQASLPQDCLNCDIRAACNGGCPKHRFLKAKSGDKPLNYYCRSTQIFYRHAKPYLEFIAQIYQSGVPVSQIGPILQQNLVQLRNEASKSRTKNK